MDLRIARDNAVTLVMKSKPNIVRRDGHLDPLTELSNVYVKVLRMKLPPFKERDATFLGFWRSVECKETSILLLEHLSLNNTCMCTTWLRSRAPLLI